MRLEVLLEEFKFNCECRRLSEKTTANYCKQIQYLIDYVAEHYQIEETDEVATRHIKAFLMDKQKAGRKPA